MKCYRCGQDTPEPAPSRADLAVALQKAECELVLAKAESDQLGATLAELSDQLRKEDWDHNERCRMEEALRSALALMTKLVTCKAIQLEEVREWLRLPAVLAANGEPRSPTLFLHYDMLAQGNARQAGVILYLCGMLHRWVEREKTLGGAIDPLTRETEAALAQYLPGHESC
jgi:hypothetical protein